MTPGTVLRLKSTGRLFRVVEVDDLGRVILRYADTDVPPWAHPWTKVAHMAVGIPRDQALDKFDAVNQENAHV